MRDPFAEPLINGLYRTTFDKTTFANWENPLEFRRLFREAHRFAADERFAGYMAELTNEAFLSTNNALKLRIADSLRVQARLPYPVIWIEYPLRAYQLRSTEIRGQSEFNTPELQPYTEGWLIRQHPRIDSAAILHIFTRDPKPDEMGFNCWTFPFAYAWCCDDVPLPWHRHIKDSYKGHYASEFIVGIKGYKNSLCGVVKSDLISLPPSGEREWLTYLVSEWTGILRRVWALLAVLMDRPVMFGEIRPSKGFLGGHQIRKGLTVKTLTLNLPVHVDTRVIARRAIAHAHRRRHDVSAHWRNDWRHPLGRDCNPHLWEPVDNDADLIECEVCHGRQIYIHKHQRGDETYGSVKHDYLLKHETE